MDGTCATFCDGNPECADDDDEMWCDMNMSGMLLGIFFFINLLTYYKNFLKTS